MLWFDEFFYYFKDTWEEEYLVDNLSYAYKPIKIHKFLLKYEQLNEIISIWIYTNWSN